MVCPPRFALAPALLTLLAGTVPGQCMTYGVFVSSGKLPVNLGMLTEVSGVAYSKHNPDVIWVHDDKGNTSHVVALRANGSLAQQYLIRGFSNTDWEDIAVGPGPVPGKSYLYIGEIGDNDKTSTTHTIIRVAEPNVPVAPGPVQTLTGGESFAFRYPGGPRDAEALAVDPLDGTPYVFTKESGNTGYVYRYPMPLDSRQTKTLVEEVSFGHAKPNFSAADFAPDGRRLYFRNGDVVFWVRRSVAGETIRQAFSRGMCSTWAGAQGNAEALAVTPDGLGLLCISEGAGETLWTARGTLPPNGPGTVASWWAYGTGTSGLFGTPGLGAVRPPILGQASIGWGVFDGRPNASGFLVLSRRAIPDRSFPFAGGFIHVVPDTVLSVALDSAGTFVLPVGILPDAAPLRGLQMHAQLLLADSTGPFGVTLSRGLTLQLDR